MPFGPCHSVRVGSETEKTERERERREREREEGERERERKRVQQSFSPSDLMRVPRFEGACSACCVFPVLVWGAVRLRVAFWSCIQHAVARACVLHGGVSCFARAVLVLAWHVVRVVFVVCCVLRVVLQRPC